MKNLYSTIIASLLTIGAMAQNYTEEFTTDPSSNIVGSVGAGAFTMGSDGNNWTIDCNGHDEWEWFRYDFDGKIDFSNPANQPILTITTTTTESVFLQAVFIDGSGRTTDANIEQAQPGFFFELDPSAGVQTFTYDFSNQFNDIHGDITDGSAQGEVDSSNITGIRFRINSGFASAPWSGNLNTYDSAFGALSPARLSIDKIEIAGAVVGLKESSILQSTTIYPNPALSQTTVNYSVETFAQIDIKVSNLLGEEIYSSTSQVGAGDYSEQLNVDSWNEGMYVLSFYANNQPVKLEKLYISK